MKFLIDRASLGADDVKELLNLMAAVMGSRLKTLKIS